MLGDGALWANAPVDLVLRAPRPAGGLVCLVIDLFPRSSARPDSIETAAARRWDLIFANQTQVAIEAHQREERLQRTIAELRSTGDRRGDASDVEASAPSPPLHVRRRRRCADRALALHMMSGGNWNPCALGHVCMSE
jgi:hypothetical protein